MKKCLKNVAFSAIALPSMLLINGCASTAPSEKSEPVEMAQAASVSAAVMAAQAMTVSFDDLTPGTQIDIAAPNWSVEKVNGSTLIAQVSADMAKSGPNSLYLLDNSNSDKPYALLPLANNGATSGTVSFDAYVPSDNPKTVYINFGTGKNNSQRYFELRLNASEGSVEYENGSPDMKIADFVPGQWHNFTAKWADGKFSILVDGVATPEGSNVAVTSTGLSSANIPTTVTFYVGDTKSVGTSVYIDNIHVR